MSSQKVILLYRKTRASGNFSIEISFDQMMAHFPQESPMVLEKRISSYASKGIVNRIKAILEVSRSRAAVNHITGDVHYLALGLPGKRTLLTIHDCGFMEQTSGLSRLLLKWFWLTLPVRKCSMISAVSEATKRDIIRYTGCSPDKIMVIPTIISKHFKRSPFHFKKDKPRILHIGLAPNKNLKRHIQALAGLNCQLHIIGKLEQKEVDLLEQYEIDFSNAYNINEAAMQKAYEACDLLLFASTLEGFGMPIVEAQTVGRPVITSNCSSMPEVAGQGAFFVDPFEVQSIRVGVQQLIDSESLRIKLINEGFKNINRFHPRQIAAQYATVYARLNA